MSRTGVIAPHETQVPSSSDNITLLAREIAEILRHSPSLATLIFDAVLQRDDSDESEPRPTAGVTPLTAAELRLLPYLRTHLTLGAIAKLHFVSRNTVSTQVQSIYRKLGVASRAEAVTAASATGLLGR
jgi:LuxR family maltose regulon positive regulatory protein